MSERLTNIHIIIFHRQYHVRMHKAVRPMNLYGASIATVLQRAIVSVHIAPIVAAPIIAPIIYDTIMHCHIKGHIIIRLLI